MTVLTEGGITDRGASSPRAKMRLLIQMAEVLEDQAAGLYRHAATSEEEEFLLHREIEERQTEINRLVLKLEAMRAERDRLMERIGSISEEATAIREEIFNGEEETALAAIEASTTEVSNTAGCDNGETACKNAGDPANDATFFRRVTLAEPAPRS